MIVLLIGIVIFFGVHLIPLTGIKILLVERIGEKKYQGVFSIISLVRFLVVMVGSLPKKGFPFTKILLTSLPLIFIGDRIG